MRLCLELAAAPGEESDRADSVGHMAAPAELFPHHVFVDLETTGLDPARDEVIEVGALFVEGGQVVRRLSRLFRPSSRLPLAIRRLTGLSDADLANEPPFSGFETELTELLRGWTVIAHNARFEQAFLCDILSEVDAPVLDSCELLHYLYPELDSHSLESVIRWAGISEGAAHRALQDCEDTFAVLQHALGSCIEEGRAEDVAEVLECLAPGEDGEEVSSRHPPLVRMVAALLVRCRATRLPLLLAEDSPFLPGPEERLRRGPRGPPTSGAPAPVQPVGDAEVDVILGPGGTLEALKDGFHSREQQVQIARRVARTLSEGGRLAVEAGTGTGKSLAYLGPAALFAARNRRRVAVAPHTRTLQDQLIEKDLPRLHRATGGGFGYALLKGQTNYLCRRRALELTATDAAMHYDERAPRAYLRAFLRRSRDGDLDR
ncbi:MAG TPA: exonuclease domain-containing protein, partial [Myxococcaceae bacterium]|nr:exonuclease domain-containing protein [Myxococcaceae bacterium]